MTDIGRRRKLSLVPNVAGSYRGRGRGSAQPDGRRGSQSLHAKALTAAEQTARGSHGNSSKGIEVALAAIARDFNVALSTASHTLSQSIIMAKQTWVATVAGASTTFAISAAWTTYGSDTADASGKSKGTDAGQTHIATSSGGDKDQKGNKR